MIGGRDRDRARALLDEVRGDLGAAVPEPDDEHALVCELATGAVVLRVQQLALEDAGPRPGRERAHVVPARGHDDGPRPQLLCGRPHDPGAVVAPDAIDGLSAAHVEAELGHVGREISGVRVLRDVARERARERVVREAREAPHRVEVEPVVAVLPRVADGLVPVEQDRLSSAALQRGRGREPGRPGADNDDLSPGRDSSPT